MVYVQHKDKYIESFTDRRDSYVKTIEILRVVSSKDLNDTLVDKDVKTDRSTQLRDLFPRHRLVLLALIISVLRRHGSHHA